MSEVDVPTQEDRERWTRMWTQYYLEHIGDSEQDAQGFAGDHTARMVAQRIAYPGKAPCWQEGCNKLGSPLWDVTAGPEDKPDACYCTQHMAEQGWCRGCHEHQGGPGALDDSPEGLCDYCASL